jgi:hypothetical protein
MGTTCNSVHVFVGPQSVDGVSRVLQAVEAGTFVSPETNGWVSVYSASHSVGDDTYAAHLSGQLKLPVIDVWCVDSDIAGASMLVDGSVLARLVVAGEDFPGVGIFEAMDDFSEMSETSIDELFATPPPSMFPHLEFLFSVTGDVDAWIAGPIGATGASIERIEARLGTCSQEPFPESIVSSFLASFGLDASRSLMTHSWIEPASDSDHASFVVGLGGAV